MIKIGYILKKTNVALELYPCNPGGGFSRWAQIWEDGNSYTTYDV
jgi:hypothetical protein